MNSRVKCARLRSILVRLRKTCQNFKNGTIFQNRLEKMRANEVQDNSTPVPPLEMYKVPFVLNVK